MLLHDESAFCCILTLITPQRRCRRKEGKRGGVEVNQGRRKAISSSIIVNDNRASIYDLM